MCLNGIRQPYSPRNHQTLAVKSACIVHVLLYLEAVLLGVGAQQEALAVLVSVAQVSLGSHPLPEIFAGARLGALGASTAAGLLDF